MLLCAPLRAIHLNCIILLIHWFTHSYYTNNLNVAKILSNCTINKNTSKRKPEQY